MKGIYFTIIKLLSQLLLIQERFKLKQKLRISETRSQYVCNFVDRRVKAERNHLT